MFDCVHMSTARLQSYDTTLAGLRQGCPEGPKKKRNCRPPVLRTSVERQLESICSRLAIDYGRLSRNLRRLSVSRCQLTES